MAPKASETAVKEAIAAATGMAVGAFYLTGSRNEIISLSWDALVDGMLYTVKAYTPPDPDPRPRFVAHEHEHRPREASAVGDALGSAGSQQPLNDGAVVLTRKPARLPRVVLACLGTARYRGIAISALESTATTCSDSFCNPFARMRIPQLGLSGYRSMFHSPHGSIFVVAYMSMQ